MGKDSAITWTTHTFNPWWGCTKVSPGCTNCYAAAFDKRVGGDHWKPNGARRFFGEKHWREPLKVGNAIEFQREHGTWWQIRDRSWIRAWRGSRWGEWASPHTAILAPDEYALPCRLVPLADADRDPGERGPIGGAP